VAENRKKELEVALQDNFVPWVSARAGALAWATRMPGAQVCTRARSGQVAGVDSLGIRNDCESVLKFVSEAIGSEVSNPMLR
jgi:hypothetical protein